VSTSGYTGDSPGLVGTAPDGRPPGLAGATQNALRPEFVELAFGEPDPRLLPVGAVRRAAAAALDRHGPAAIAYGSSQGPRELRAALAERIAAHEAVPLEADEIVVTGGNSQALDQVLTVFTAPGDVVLVEVPTYNLALLTMRDHPVDVVGVPHDADGLDVEALAATLDTLRAEGRRARLLYTIPTFHNPTGVCLSAARRVALAARARDEDLLLVEDDVYRELAYDGKAPPSLWGLGPDAPVLRLGTFSKSLTPGLRVGWVTGRADLRARFAAAGMVESGGCPSQFAAAVAGELLTSGEYDGHVASLRAAYRSRRDTLVAGLREHLPAGCGFTVPAGGFFIWAALPAGLTATALASHAERHGVSFIPGSSFATTGEDTHVRLAFSLYDEITLAEGARRLAAAVSDALRASD
jgi:DNA-binding transcriptional MocR family regulator